MQFRHKLTANNISKTAKITKRPTNTSPACQCAAESPFCNFCSFRCVTRR